MAKKKKKYDFLKDKEFIKAFTEMCIDGWDSQLRGENLPAPMREVYMCASDEQETKRLIVAFEKKYKRKLKYRIKGLTYISYEETEVFEEYRQF